MIGGTEICQDMSRYVMLPWGETILCDFILTFILQRFESKTGKANCDFDPFSEEEGELEAKEVEMDVGNPTDVSGGSLFFHCVQS